MRNGFVTHHERLSSDVHEVTGTVLGSEDKNVTSGIVGLDGNGLILPSIIPSCFERYSNHLGNVDNFTETSTGGNGTAVEDTTNHKIDLITGLTIVGYAIFQAKQQFTLSSIPIIVSFKLQNIVNGSGSVIASFVGLRDDFSLYNSNYGLYFLHSNDGSWSIVESNVTIRTTGISSLSNGDVCTIVCTSSKVVFYVNGIVVYTATDYIPSTALYVGASVVSASSPATVARELGIDMMNIKRYL